MIRDVDILDQQLANTDPVMAVRAERDRAGLTAVPERPYVVRERR